MSKVTLAPLANLQQQTTAVNTINSNFQLVSNAIDNTLSRDGTPPNSMGSNLDMNNNQILNLPAPATINSPVRLVDVPAGTGVPIASVPPVGTSGAVVPFLNGNNTWSGTNTYNPTPTFTLAPATSGNILVGDGTKWNSVAVSGGGILNSSGVLTINSGTFVTPEQYGAIGDGNPLTGTGTDDTAAFTAMYNDARAAGYINARWTAGKTYCITNPYLFAGVKVHIIEGNGANLMNVSTAFTPVTGQPIGQFANFQTFAQANPFWTNGANLATGAVGSYGQLINTVAANSLTVTVQSGNCPTGPVLLYGFERLGSLGFPPASACFEYNYIVSAVGAIGTLRTPTKYAYDSQWFALNDPGNPGSPYPGSGQAYILSLNLNTVPWCDYLYIKNVNFLRNPSAAFTAPASGGRTFNGFNGGTNGAALPSGVTTSIFENCSMETSNTTMLQNAYYNGCTFTNTDNLVQPDKLVDLLHFKDCTFASTCVLAGGISIKEIIVENCTLPGNNGLAPIDHLIINRGKWMGRDYQSASALIGDSVYGSAQVTVDKTTFIPPSTVDRILESHIKSGVVTVVSTNVLSMTRAAYDASGFCHSMRIGAILRNVAGLPAFRITRLPYTLGNLVSGDIRFEGDNLTNITTGDTLFMPVVPEITIKDPIYSGSFASNITSLWGTQFFAVPYPMGNTRDRYIGNDWIRITSDMEVVPRTSNLFRMELGGLFSISEVIINVSRVAVSATAVTMNLNYVDAVAASNQIWQTLDLKTLGKRIVDRTGSFGVVGADVFGTSGIGTTNAAQIKWQDTWVTPGDMVQPNLPEWSITFYGNWIGGYEGER